MVYLIMTAKSLLLTAFAAFASVTSAFAEEGDEKKKCDKKGKGISAEKKAELLKKFDKDGDGKLSEEEREAAKAARKAMILEKFDKDGDGELNEEERKAARAEMGPKRGKGPKGKGKGKGKGPKGKGKGDGADGGKGLL